MASLSRGLRLAVWVAILWAGALTVVVGVLVSNALSATDRTRALVDAMAARATMEAQADCAFKRDVARLPSLSPRPTATLVQLARDARTAYLGKGCPGAIDPDTGRPFGPPPTVPAPAR